MNTTLRQSNPFILLYLYANTMMIGFDTKHRDDAWLVMGVAVIINSLAIWVGNRGGM